MSDGPTPPFEAWQYTSPERYDLEFRTYLARSWVFFVLETQLGSLGDTVAQCIFGVPVLVRRGEDGALHGFINVCRHRAGPIVSQGKTVCRVLRCQYHGWMYDQHGRLSGTPGFGRDLLAFASQGEYDLLKVDVGSWNGFVFVRLSNDPSHILLDSIGELEDLLSDFELEQFTYSETLQFQFACNWKLYVENWLESYHIPWIHRALSQDVRISGYNVEPRKNVVVHRARARSKDPVYGGLWVWVAPCVALNFYQNGLSIERILPVAADQTKVEYLFLFKDSATPAERDAALEMCRVVTGEDGGMCEMVHKNLQAGVPLGPLSPIHETGIQHFHDLVREGVRRGAPNDVGADATAEPKTGSGR